MKKVIKSRIFLIIVLCIISCGIGVYAAVTYKASDVLYTSSDGTSMNVNDALNELYNRSSSQIIKLGNGTSFNLKTLQDTGKIPQNINLNELTSNNFIVEIISLSTVKTGTFGGQAGGLSWYASAAGSTINKTYNSTSFLLTISGYNQNIYCHRIENSDWPTTSTSIIQTMSFNVYLVLE